MTSPQRPPVLLAFAFRPFFLLTGLYGLLIVLAWMGFLFGGLSLPVGMNPMQWHAHEMLMGLVPPAIAGFLLTAMCNWTGAPPLQGRGLLALVLLWIAGRVVMWSAGVLPGWLVFSIDMAFLPVLAIYAGKVLYRYGNKRNFILVGLLGLLTLTNLLMHLAALNHRPLLGQVAEVLALDLIAVVLVVVAGRITPAFTANWLRIQGQNPAAVKRSEALDRVTLAATLLMIPADLITGVPALGGVVALVAAALNLVRLVGWAGWKTLREPLLWILHLGYLWIPLALFIKGLTPFVDQLLPTSWFHAMGTGAIATLILGVMTRVALGHTGRPLKLPKLAVLIYLGISLAALARVLVTFNLADYRLGLMVSALGWSVAFTLFVLLYWSILSSPRADGRPG